MRYLLSFLFLLMMHTTTQAQDDFDIGTDPETGQKIFKGELSFDALEKEPSFTWLKEGKAAYKPDSATIATLKPLLKNYNIVVLLGTWCEDTHRLLPQLYKVLEATHYPLAQCQMFGVDRAKEAKYQEHIIYRLQKVPTIIIRRGPKEVGRITETVKQSVEKDIAAIIEADKKNPE